MRYLIQGGGRLTRRYLKAALLAGSAIALAGPAWAQETSNLEEVVVTAQRRAENIMDVPISITSFSNEALDTQGVRAIDDLSRLTPSLRFTRSSGVSANNGANIAIRGIASDVGAATTAIYIDDTPVQIRSIGYFSGNPYPRIFDIDRVEVLRGPQGTLFGAGAEGGAVRFLTPQPKAGALQVYGRSELATTKNGAPSGEVGVAVGGGVTDTLSFRASAWRRRDGGYIDRIDERTGAVIDDDANWEDTTSARLAVTWAPTPQFSVTPSIYYQSVKSGGRNQYWEGQSDVADRDYVAGPALPEKGDDQFVLSAVKAEYDFGDIQLISNTSYFDRENSQTLNYFAFQNFLRTGSEFGTYPNQDRTNSGTFIDTTQKNFVQEVRLQSYPEGSSFGWTAGVFYSKAEQTNQNLTGSSRRPGVISSGSPQYLGRYNLLDLFDSEDEQIAAFGSLDWKPIEKLKITVAARVSRNEFNVTELRDGPVNSGMRTLDVAKMTDEAFTPKIGVQYDISDDRMVYASASKGFRPGGAQPPVDPLFCGADLATLNLTASPRSYDSDSLWSYEVGAKGGLADNRLLVDVNAYYVKWKNIQQSVNLPTCSFSFVDNLGEATAKGVDLSLSFKAADWLRLGINVGYNDTTYDQTVLGGGGVVLHEAGDRIGGPRWTGSAFAEAEWPLRDAVDGYARADYTFQSSGVDPNPAAFGYDPGLPGLPASDYLSLRAGVRFDRYDVSAFVNNLLDANEPLSRSNDGFGSLVYYAETYRPRTFGLTVTYRY